jgi:uncharacterized protein (UPF0276 family)
MDAAGTGLLWDVAHSFITANNTGQKIKDYLKDLGVEKCRQIHLSRYNIEKGFAWDTHDVMQHNDWEYFIACLPKLTQLKYVTIEYYKDFDKLLNQLERLNFFLEGKYE